VTVSPDVPNAPGPSQQQQEGQEEEQEEVAAGAGGGGSGGGKSVPCERLQLQCGGEALKISHPHYDKLRALFHLHSGRAAAGASRYLAVLPLHSPGPLRWPAPGCVLIAAERVSAPLPLCCAGGRLAGDKLLPR
jgi:hypothetical protein